MAFMRSDFTGMDNGPTGLISLPGPDLYNKTDGRQHSKTPITTTTSVLGLILNEGVIIAADTQGSYGSLARFRDCPRVFKVNNNILLRAGGDYADFQYLKDIITQKIVDDGFTVKPKALYHWLTRILYNRRSQFDPLWNSFVIGGIENGVPFMGTVDKLGTAFQDEHIATGFGAYLAIPKMRAAVQQAKAQGGLNQQQAIQILKKCLEVLFYRDARSWPKYQFGIITKDGVTLEGPFSIESNWDVATASTFMNTYHCLMDLHLVL